MTPKAPRSRVLNDKDGRLNKVGIELMGGRNQKMALKRVHFPAPLLLAHSRAVYCVRAVLRATHRAAGSRLFSG